MHIWLLQVYILLVREYQASLVPLALKVQAMKSLWVDLIISFYSEQAHGVAGHGAYED